MTARNDPDPPSPRQQAILALIAESLAPVSATELASLSGLTLGATAHHVRALARSGMITQADERRVRGALQTFYRETELGLNALRRGRAEALITLVGASTHTINGLDDHARSQLHALVDEVRPRVERILEDAALRPPGTET